MRWEEFFRFGAGPGRHGAVSLLDGAAFDISPRLLAITSARQQWEQPYAGVRYLPGSSPTFWRRHAGALLATGGTEWDEGRLAIARFAALHAHGLLERPKPFAELIRAHHLRATTQPGIRTFRTRRLAENDVTEIEGLPCTVIARTLRDLSWTLNANALRACAIPAIQRGLLRTDELEAQREGMGHGLAARRFDALLEQLRGTKADSEFEWEVRAGLDERGMEPWPAPFPWRCRDGVKVELDIAFPAAWFCIECDGKAKYMLGADFTTDRIRWSEINRDWQILWLDVNRWRSSRRAVLDDIERRLEAADRSRPAAQPAESD